MGYLTLKALHEFIDYTAISAGMALAISCYAVVADMLKVEYGTMVSFAMLCAAVICIFAALSVAELASMFPSAPGIRTYLKQAFGNRFSLLVTFMYLAMVMLVAGIESFAFAKIAGRVGIMLPEPVLAALLISLVVFLNLRGIELTYKVQSVLTLSLFITFMGVSLYALTVEQHAVVSNDIDVPEDWPVNLPLLIGMAIFLFIGFEWVTPLGRKPESYRRLVPWSMPVAIILLTGLYGLFVMATLYVIPEPNPAMANTPQLLLGQLLFDKTGLYLMAILSVLAMLTSFNAGLMGASRLIYAIAREGELPKWCASLSLPACVPYAAIWIIGLGALLAALLTILFQSYLAIAIVAAVITCLTYLTLILANLHLRFTQPDLERQFRSPLPVAGQAALALLFMVLGIGTLISIQGQSALIIFLIIFMMAMAISHFGKLSNFRFLKTHSEKT